MVRIQCEFYDFSLQIRCHLALQTQSDMMFLPLLALQHNSYRQQQLQDYNTKNTMQCNNREEHRSSNKTGTRRNYWKSFLYHHLHPIPYKLWLRVTISLCCFIMSLITGLHYYSCTATTSTISMQSWKSLPLLIGDYFQGSIIHGTTRRLCYYDAVQNTSFSGILAFKCTVIKNNKNIVDLQLQFYILK